MYFYHNFNIEKAYLPQPKQERNVPEDDKKEGANVHALFLNP